LHFIDFVATFFLDDGFAEKGEKARISSSEESSVKKVAIV